MRPLNRVEPKPASLFMKAIAAFRSRLAERKATIDMSGHIHADSARMHHAAHQSVTAKELIGRRPK